MLVSHMPFPLQPQRNSTNLLDCELLICFANLSALAFQRRKTTKLSVAVIPGQRVVATFTDLGSGQ